MASRILLERLVEIESEESTQSLLAHPNDFMSSEFVLKNSICSDQSVMIKNHSEHESAGGPNKEKNKKNGSETYLSHSRTYYKWTDEVSTITGLKILTNTYLIVVKIKNSKSD